MGRFWHFPQLLPILSSMELEDKRALVTGGGRGIGRAIALALARQGARVALLSRTRSQLEEVAAEVEGLGREARICVADMARESQIRAAVGDVLEAWGGVDILVNNAGVLGPVGPAHEVDVEAWEHTIQINLVGCFACSRWVLPHMMAQRYGKIINLSGGGAVSPRPRFSAYSASKAGIVRFTETLSEEVAAYGIDVNAMAPGAINTAMLDQVLQAGAAAGEEVLAEARQQLQSGGVDPERPAALAVFLASPRSDGLSGRLISAVWDSWEEMDIETIMASEVYTMRRLKPE